MAEGVVIAAVSQWISACTLSGSKSLCSHGISEIIEPSDSCILSVSASSCFVCSMEEALGAADSVTL